MGDRFTKAVGPAEGQTGQDKGKFLLASGNIQKVVDEGKIVSCANM
jgi:hypothetical protein